MVSALVRLPPGRSPGDPSSFAQITIQHPPSQPDKRTHLYEYPCLPFELIEPTRRLAGGAGPSLPVSTLQRHPHQAGNKASTEPQELPYSLLLSSTLSRAINRRCLLRTTPTSTRHHDRLLTNACHQLPESTLHPPPHQAGDITSLDSKQTNIFINTINPTPSRTTNRPRCPLYSRP